MVVAFRNAAKDAEFSGRWLSLTALSANDTKMWCDKRPIRSERSQRDNACQHSRGISTFDGAVRFEGTTQCVRASATRGGASARRMFNQDGGRPEADFAIPPDRDSSAAASEGPESRGPAFVSMRRFMIREVKSGAAMGGAVKTIKRVGGGSCAAWAARIGDEPLLPSSSFNC